MFTPTDRHFLVLSARSLTGACLRRRKFYVEIVWRLRSWLLQILTGAIDIFNVQ